MGCAKWDNGCGSFKDLLRSGQIREVLGVVNSVVSGWDTEYVLTGLKIRKRKMRQRDLPILEILDV